MDEREVPLDLWSAASTITMSRVMAIFDVTAILVTIAAVFSFINYRFIKLPAAIGLMLIALVMSLGLVALAMLGTLRAM